MLLFISAMGIPQGCLFNPKPEKQNYSLWYQTYYLNIDFSPNLNFALIISEKVVPFHTVVAFWHLTKEEKLRTCSLQIFRM